MFEGFGIVRSCKSAGTQELEKIIKAIFACPRRFVVRRQRPRVDHHVVGSHWEEGPDRQGHDIVNDEIGENEEIAILHRDPVGTALAVAQYQLVVLSVDSTLPD